MNEAIGAAVLERIATLWRRRAWYASHLGWVVQSKVEDDRELRQLVRLAREARRAVEDAEIATTVWHIGQRPAGLTTVGWTEPELREAWGR